MADSAQAEPTDQRECRIANGGEPVERRGTALDERAGGLRIADIAELADIGTGDEAVRLARADDEPARRIRVERVEHRVEFSEYRCRQRVRRRLSNIPSAGSVRDFTNA